MPGRFLVGVSVFLTRGDRVLLVRRASDRDHGAGSWEPVSGRLEQGESPPQAAAREVLEETGLEVHALRPFDTFALVREPTMEELIGISYHGIAGDGPVTLSSEHEEARWMSRDELRDVPAPAGVRASIQSFLSIWSR